jgi:hypothetical protein
MSFIVRISIDESLDEPGQVEWHGQVTHVPGGKHRHVHSLDEVMEFVAPYLIESGVPQERAARFWQTNLVTQGERKMSDIKWTLSLDVLPDGPKFKLDRTSKADAYERVDIQLVPGEQRVVGVKPTESLMFMMVRRSDVPANTDPKPDPEKLYYTINDKDDQKFPLDYVHLLLGLQIKQLLGKPLETMKFKNEQDQPVWITVLLARNIIVPEKATSSSGAKGTGDGGSSRTTQATSP